MKQIVTSLFASALVLFSATTNAQGSYALAKPLTNIMTHDERENIVATGEMPASMVSSKVLQAFDKTFNCVTPHWYATGNDYLARFTGEGTITHALYQKNGYMVYSVTKGSSRLLPAGVVSLLRDAYPEYEISAATKAVSSGTTAWIADMKLGPSLVVVKVIDGDIVEATHYINRGK